MSITPKDYIEKVCKKDKNGNLIHKHGKNSVIITSLDIIPKLYDNSLLNVTTSKGTKTWRTNCYENETELKKWLDDLAKEDNGISELKLAKR